MDYDIVFNVSFNKILYIAVYLYIKPQYIVCLVGLLGLEPRSLSAWCFEHHAFARFAIVPYCPAKQGLGGQLHTMAQCRFRVCGDLKSLRKTEERSITMKKGTVG